MTPEVLFKNSLMVLRSQSSQISCMYIIRIFFVIRELLQIYLDWWKKHVIRLHFIMNFRIKSYNFLQDSVIDSYQVIDLN